MARVIKTAGDIVAAWDGKGECDLFCRTCKGRIVDDAPETPWVCHDGLGKHLLVDWHERCEPKP